MTDDEGFDVDVDDAQFLTETEIISGNLSNPLPSGATEIFVVALKQGHHYSIAVVVVDEKHSNSPLSNIVEVDLVPPAAIKDLRVTDRSGIRVTLEWTTVGDDGNNETGMSGKFPFYKACYSFYLSEVILLLLLCWICVIAYISD